MRRVAVILVALLGCALAMQAVGVHRALVIGLGKQKDASWGKINGDNDVTYVVNMLQKMGYTDIRTLRNEQATKQGIVNAFNQLAARCGKGDIVYIHYSGHGQLVTDIDGDEALRWNGNHSQWDESWVPYDAYMHYCAQDRGDKHLVDDELAVLLTAIRNKIGSRGQLVVVADCCHSGDATRGDLQDECVRGVDTKFNIPKPINTPMPNLLPEKWLTISACKPYELCGEISTLRVGKLTYAMFNLSAGLLKCSNSQMQRQLDNFIKKYPSRIRQTPMITGNR